MGNVYSLDTDKNLILYSSGSNIYLRTAIGSTLARPVILCNDYSDSLSDIVHNNTIYYAYRNTNQDIVVKSITDLHDLYRINSCDMPDCFLPRVAVLKGFFILFYLIKNPMDDSYCLKALCPFNSDKVFSVPDKCFSNMPVLRIISLTDSLIIYLGDDKSELLFRVKEDLKYDILSKEESIILKYENILNEEKKALQALNDKHEAKKSELCELEREFAQNKEALSQTRAELAAAKEQASKYAVEVDRRDQIIESIKNQYNELMNTAAQYRNEAIKWYNKFHV